MSETATETPAVEPRVLVIAGSDSGGGAGIQADIKTITALDAYAATAISALTAQNTLEVSDILPVPPDFLQAQITAVLNDIGADCIKTGMLHDVPAIETVAQALQTQAPHIPVVVDPVMVSQSGAELLADSAIDCLREQLLPRATLLTPNLPEAEKLLGRTLADREARIEAARELLALGPDAVLLKGGHAKGTTCSTYWRTPRAWSALRRRGCPPVTPTAPAARWPVPSPPASPRGCRCATRWCGAAPTCTRPCARRGHWARGRPRQPPAHHPPLLSQTAGEAPAAPLADTARRLAPGPVSGHDPHPGDPAPGPAGSAPCHHPAPG